MGKIILAMLLAASISSASALEVTVGTGGATAWSVPVAGIGYGAYKLFGFIFSPERVLGYAGREAAVVGLQQLSPEKARAVAANTLIVCGDLVGPNGYLVTGALPTADIVNQIITAKFGTLDPAILAMLQAVASKLGQYVPSASVLLTANEIGYLVAFIRGVQTGCTDYLANQNVSVKHKYTTEKQNIKQLKKLKNPGAVPWFSPVVATPCEGK